MDMFFTVPTMHEMQAEFAHVKRCAMPVHLRMHAAFKSTLFEDRAKRAPARPQWSAQAGAT